MKSPFKFLDAYTLKDRDAFFGREQEVEQLFEMTTENRLLLVYGQSGTGKTSLVQCGLAGRFYRTDWYPMFIRRGEDINVALEEALAKPMGGEVPGGIPETIEELYANFLRPIYLIFDQLEELFILGSPEEQSRFIHTIAEITEANLPCRILFILREEYLAHLYGFEKVIPTLFDRRLRVEPMSLAKVGEVIGKSCARFNISLEAPEHNVQQIIDNVSAGKSGIQLPYLQVYLDMLWREDYGRAYGEKEPADGRRRTADGAAAEKPKDQNTKTPPLTFTTAEIAQFGRIDDVLHQFLLEQEAMIQDNLRKAYPALPEQAVRQVLDAFVTPEGTKRPVHFERQEGSGLIILEENVQKLLPALAAPPSAETSQTDEPSAVRRQPSALTPSRSHPLTSILESLEQSRILRFGDDAIELAHDSLARLIDEQRTEEQRQLNEVKNRIASAYREWERTEQQEYLTRKQLDSFEALLPKVQLEPHLNDFVRASRAVVEEGERRERQRRRLFIGAILLVAALMGVAALVSYGYQLRAKASEQRADERRMEADSARQELALLVDSLDTTIKQLDEQKEASDSLAQEAKEQGAVAQNALSGLEANTREAMPVLIRNIDILIRALDYKTALTRSKTAWNINPDNPEVGRRFQEIAYFFTESKNHAEAEAALAYIGRKPAWLSHNQEERHEELLSAIKSIDASYFHDSLEKRYYPVMVNIKGGSFCMGRDPKLKGDCDTSDVKVILDDFKLGKTEVTVWQFNLYCIESGQDSLERIQRGLDWELEGDNPIVRISWYDAVLYCNWLSMQNGLTPVYLIDTTQVDKNNTSDYDNMKWVINLDSSSTGFRLPTDAEWEYAARGGIKKDTFLYSGSDDLDLVAWWSNNSSGRTHPAAFKKANGQGLHDMSGNVWEWCWDWHAGLEPGVFSNPRGPISGSRRLVRGGSWDDGYTRSCEVSIRVRDDPGYRDDSGGFRLSQD